MRGNARDPADGEQGHFRRLDAIAAGNEDVPEFVERHAGEQENQKDHSARGSIRSALAPCAEGDPNKEQQEGNMDLDRGSAEAADGEGPGHGFGLRR